MREPTQTWSGRLPPEYTELRLELVVDRLTMV